MNNARMWCVVRPTVGLPLIFLGVATASLAIHFSVLTNTPWFGQFFNGQSLSNTAAVLPDSGTLGSNAVVHFSGDAVDGKQTAIVELADGRLAKVTFEQPVVAPANAETEVAAVQAAQ